MSKNKTRGCQVVREIEVTALGRKVVAHVMPYHGGGVGDLYEFPGGIVVADADIDWEDLASHLAPHDL